MQWRNLFSSRAWITALTLPIIAFYVLGAVWKPLGYVAGILLLVLCLAWLVSPENVLYCPYCKKRVKVGASACHHCGRSVL
jgi:hypothetical protein